MPTMTRDRRPVKNGRKPELVVSLALSINHMVYTVEPIRSEDPDVIRAWRLTKKSDGDLYDVAQTTHGPTCDCGDFEFRHSGLDDAGCKHIAALRLTGLLDAPVPIASNAPDRCPLTPELPAIVPATPAPVEVRASTPGPCCNPVEAAPCVACVAAVEVADVQAALDPAAAPVTAQAVAELLPAFDPFPPDRLDAGDGEAPPELWPDWTDNWFWTPDEPESDTPGPDTADEPAEAPAPLLSLAELVEAVAVAYRSWPVAAGAMIARHLEDLAQRIRFVSATTPAEYEARAELIDRESRDQWEAIGFDAGRSTCPCRQRRGFEFGHSA
jgi:hypothetical protein